MRALLDANIFVSIWTLDVLLSAADAGLYEPVWSDNILAEAVRAMEKMHPQTVNSFKKVVAAAERAFPYAKDEAATLQKVPSELPDPDDIHVLATAMTCNADVIVTYNVRDFPFEKTDPIKAIHPDDFLLDLLICNIDTMLIVIDKLVLEKAHPPRSMDEELAALRKNHLTRFADQLERAIR